MTVMWRKQRLSQRRRRLNHRRLMGFAAVLAAADVHDQSMSRYSRRRMEQPGKYLMKITSWPSCIRQCRTPGTVDTVRAEPFAERIGR
jgi:hypothetical protein